MNHSTHPTEDYSNSRHLYSKILLDSRNLVASQKQFVTVTYYSSYIPFKSYTREEFNIKHFDVLVSQKYDQLRGLYDIPFHFDEFSSFMRRHPDVKKWCHYGYYSSDAWARWRLRHDTSTGQYYRVGPKFVQHGIEPKEIDEKEQSNRDWHKKKKDRDYRRRCNGRYSSARGWAKKDQNRSDRRRAKRNIREGNYDQLFTHEEPRDWWMWD